jgi:hypothetical protein
MTRTHVRIRVHEAVEAAVRDAADLAERSNADSETRLRMVVDGWGRGLAAALEELAVSLDELWRLMAPSDPAREEAPPPPPQAPPPAEPAGESPPPATDEDEDQLRARAAASRAETKAVGEETP